jgi:hypothetical protein
VVLELTNGNYLYLPNLLLRFYATTKTTFGKLWGLIYSFIKKKPAYVAIIETEVIVEKNSINFCNLQVIASKIIKWQNTCNR